MIKESLFNCCHQNSPSQLPGQQFHTHKAATWPYSLIESEGQNTRALTAATYFGAVRTMLTSTHKMEPRRLTASKREAEPAAPVPSQRDVSPSVLEFTGTLVQSQFANYKSSINSTNILQKTGNRRLHK